MSIINKKIDVLNAGFVVLKDVMGSDLSVVNAARVSMGKESSELNEADEKLISYLAKHNHWCYDDKTEIFTEDGWKLFSDLTENDKVAEVFGWEKDSASFIFSKPLEIHQCDYEGNMISVENNVANYCVTPRHRMLVKKRKSTGFSNFEIGTSDDLFLKTKWMLTSAKLQQKGVGTFSEGAYIGFLLGDGFRISKNLVCVRLKKERKIKYLLGLLFILGLEYTQKNKDGVTIINIKDSITYLPSCSEKRIPSVYDKSSDFINGLFDGLVNSDGSIKHSGWDYSSSSLQLFNDFKFLAVLCGYQVRDRGSRHLDNSKHNINYKCSVLSRKHCVINNKKKEEFLLPYKGKVYCVTVPSGMVLVRRNGFQLVCGNTPFSHPQVTFLIKAPLFVRSQLFKHKVGLTENEISRRYVDDEPDFFIPEQSRKKVKNIKQGSSDPIDDYVFNSMTKEIFNSAKEHGLSFYNSLLINGVAPELARAVLPQSMFTEWYWTGSLFAFSRICKQRIDPHAQYETRQYALAIFNFLKELFPVSMASLINIDEVK